VGVYCGADVDFVDIDPDTYVMSVPALTAKLQAARKAGRLPKIVTPVHFAGQSCDMAAIGALAAEYGFRIIEDASHAIGATYRGAPVGNCAYSDICVFSFHPVKIITTAEGGIATTQDTDLAARMSLHSSHGLTRDPTLMTGHNDGLWYYEQVDLGYNYRMTEMQAALGLSQMDRLDAFVTRRNALADRYDELLADMAVQQPFRMPDCYSAFHLYPVLVNDRARIFAEMRAAGIGVNVHYIPIHTQPFYARRGFRPGDFPQAEAYYAKAISIPLYAGLSEADQDRVVSVLRSALDG
jgi:dTDP-4-amino-4,6-dideoxygalactose transaminase